MRKTDFDVRIEPKNILLVKLDLSTVKCFNKYRCANLQQKTRKRASRKDKGHMFTGELGYPFRLLRTRNLGGYNLPKKGEDQYAFRRKSQSSGTGTFGYR